MSSDTVTREHFDATVDKLTALILSMAAKPEVSPVLTREEAMTMTGHTGVWGFYSWAEKWQLKPFAKARYRREDVRDAIARAAVSAGNGVRRSPRKKISAKQAA